MIYLFKCDTCGPFEDMFCKVDQKSSKCPECGKRSKRTLAGQNYAHSGALTNSGWRRQKS